MGVRAIDYREGERKSVHERERERGTDQGCCLPDVLFSVANRLLAIKGKGNYEELHVCLV